MSFESSKKLREFTTERWIEIAAVVFNFLYTLLYLNSNSLCFAFGIVGPLLLAWIYLKEHLYAETALQFIYILLSVYGWAQPAKWDLASRVELNHGILCLVGFTMIVLLGKCLQNLRRPSFPYADSSMTILAIIGTVLMILYVPEGWLYLLASNVVAIMICYKKQLYIAVAMYMIYIVMSIDGYWQYSLFY